MDAAYLTNRAEGQTVHHTYIMRVTAIVALGLLLAILTACEPEPTPFPVDLPVTPTPTISPAELPPLRYALLPNTLDALPDLALLQASANVTTLTDANADLTGYQVIAGYGIITDWTRSALTPHVMLVMNPNAPPLDAPQITAIIRRALDPNAISTALNIPGLEPFPMDTAPAADLRTELANSGNPDGLALVMGVAATPSAELIAAQLQAANIRVQRLAVAPSEVRPAFERGQIQLALVMSSLEAERASWVSEYGAEHVLALYAVPISYRAEPGLSLSFTPLGFPLATR